MPSRRALTAFARRRPGGELCCEKVALERIAEEVGTPCYVYSRAQLLANYRALAAAKPELICYAVKALGNLAVLSVLAGEGSGFDVVSLGELRRVQRAGGDSRRVVFSGVGKTEADLQATLASPLACYNVESEAELQLLSRLAQAHGKSVPIALRVNPDVDGHTHPYIATALKSSKFGIPIQRARAIYREAAHLPGLRVVGVDCHLGSQFLSLRPYRAALTRLRGLVAELRADGHRLEHLDIGGGLGVSYGGEHPPALTEWVRALKGELRGKSLGLFIEPGRAIAANAGVLLSSVLRRKRGGDREFAVVDAGMNDLLRPALYGARHAVEPLQARPVGRRRLELVGPICESADSFGRYLLPEIEEGDCVAFMNAGAYGFAMASNYNARPRPAEVLVDGAGFAVVRERESIEDLWRGERIPPQH